MAADMGIPLELLITDLTHYWPRSDVEVGRAEKDE